MRSRYYPAVARQGWWFIFFLLAAALFLISFCNWVSSLPLWLAAALVAYLFRDPERRIPAKPLGLIAPVDGCVVAAEEGEDPYLERRASRIRLKGSATGSYVVRSPMEGKLLKQWYAVPGGESRSRALLASWIQSDEGDDVVLVIRPRIGWLRLRSNISPGERTGQGMRFCFSPFGAEVEVWMPPATRIETQPGQSVCSGSDIIGTLNHDAQKR